MVNHGLRDPHRSTPGTWNLDTAFKTYLRKCKEEDLAPRPQQALPSLMVQWITNHFSDHKHIRMRVTGHLIVLAFFFLLRVGEYTQLNKLCRIIPLQKSDIKLWHDGKVLDNESTPKTLATADAITICLENQKNGHKNFTLHHTMSGVAAFDLVKSGTVLVSQLHHMIPLRKSDIKLWRDGKVLDNESTPEILATADAIMICLENQKNGHKNCTLHHTMSGMAAFNLVKSSAVLVSQLHHMPANVPVGTYKSAANLMSRITAAEIRSTIQIGMKGDRLVKCG